MVSVGATSTVRPPRLPTTRTWECLVIVDVLSDAQARNRSVPARTSMSTSPRCPGVMSAVTRRQLADHVDGHSCSSFSANDHTRVGGLESSRARPRTHGRAAANCLTVRAAGARRRGRRRPCATTESAVSVSSTVATPDADGVAVSFARVLAADVGERAFGVRERHIDQRADELVAAVADDEVVGAHPFADRGDDVDEQRSPAACPSVSLTCLRPSTSRKITDDPPAADAAGSVDLALQRGRPALRRSAPVRSSCRSDLDELAGVPSHLAEPVERGPKLRRSRLASASGLSPSAVASTLRVTSTERRRPFLQLRLRGPPDDVARWRVGRPARL